MLDAVAHRALDQRARGDGVVEVVAERVGDRVRHHDRAGEMDHGLDLVPRHHRADERLVGDVADHERNARRQREAEPGAEIVEHHHRLAGIRQLMDGMAADIAGTAGDEYG